MKRLKSAVLLFCLMAVTSVLAEDFRLSLGIEGGQVRDLILGVQENATDGFDQEWDVMVPPFGMGTGIVGLLPGGKDTNLLYRDVRGPSLPKTWRVSLAPSRRSIVVSWKVAELPPNTVCQLEYNGVKLDMRQCSQLSVKNKTVLVLTISSKDKP